MMYGDYGTDQYVADSHIPFNASDIRRMEYNLPTLFGAKEQNQVSLVPMQVSAPVQQPTTQPTPQQAPQTQPTPQIQQAPIFSDEQIKNILLFLFAVIIVSLYYQQQQINTLLAQLMQQRKMEH
jgi:hypothetical protein